MKGQKPILALDFDGVLHEYDGWKGETHFNGPVEGAAEFVAAAMAYFDIVVVSSRLSSPAGFEAVYRWFQRAGFPSGIKLSQRRPAAFVTLDDRALTFTGLWPDVQALREFQPWWQKPGQGEAS